MTSAILLIFGASLGLYWMYDTVNEIERYEENDDYEQEYGTYKFWLLVCLVWTPIALYLGPVLINAMILIPMTIRFIVTYYYEELR